MVYISVAKMGHGRGIRCRSQGARLDWVMFAKESGWRPDNLVILICAVGIIDAPLDSYTWPLNGQGRIGASN